MIDEEKNEIYVSKWTEDDLQLWHAPTPLKPLVLNQKANARLKMLPSMGRPPSGWAIFARTTTASDINGLRKLDIKIQIHT